MTASVVSDRLKPTQRYLLFRKVHDQSCGGSVTGIEGVALIGHDEDREIFGRGHPDDGIVLQVAPRVMESRAIACPRAAEDKPSESIVAAERWRVQPLEGFRLQDSRFTLFAPQVCGDELSPIHNRTVHGPGWTNGGGVVRERTGCDRS